MEQLYRHLALTKLKIVELTTRNEKLEKKVKLVKDLKAMNFALEDEIKEISEAFKHMRSAFDKSLTIKQQYESLIATLVMMDSETNKKVQLALK